MAKADGNSDTNANTAVTDDKLTRAEIMRDVRALVPTCRKGDVEAARDALAAEEAQRRVRKRREVGWRDDMIQFRGPLERVHALAARARLRMPKPEPLDLLDK